MTTKLRDLFEHFQGCTNHDCLMTGPKKGMITKASCACSESIDLTDYESW